MTKQRTQFTEYETLETLSGQDIHRVRQIETALSSARTVREAIGNLTAIKQPVRITINVKDNIQGKIVKLYDNGVLLYDSAEYDGVDIDFNTRKILGVEYQLHTFGDKTGEKLTSFTIFEEFKKDFKKYFKKAQVKP